MNRYSRERACASVAAIIAMTCMSCSKAPLLPEVHVERVTGVIVPPAFVADELYQCSRETPGGEATPAQLTHSDLAEFEAGVAAFVAAHPPDRKYARVDKLESYHRRYVGIYRHGHRRMYVSLVRINVVGPPPEWRTMTFSVCGGGVSAFGLEYDLDSHEFTHIAYNAPM